MRRWPLVGRQTEFDTIRTAITGGGGMCGVVVTGDAGVGKTTLAREVTSTLEGVRWVAGTESARSVPLGAFAHLVGNTSARDPGDVHLCCAGRAGRRRAARDRCRRRASARPTLRDAAAPTGAGPRGARRRDRSQRRGGPGRGGVAVEGRLPHPARPAAVHEGTMRRAGGIRPRRPPRGIDRRPDLGGLRRERALPAPSRRRCVGRGHPTQPRRRLAVARTGRGHQGVGRAARRTPRPAARRRTARPATAHPVRAARPRPAREPRRCRRRRAGGAGGPGAGGRERLGWELHGCEPHGCEPHSGRRRPFRSFPPSAVRRGRAPTGWPGRGAPVARRPGGGAARARSDHRSGPDPAGPTSRRERPRGRPGAAHRRRQ